MVSIHGPVCRTKTFPTQCRVCGDAVYFFSCDCGSRVYFDELGQPWPLHDCFHGHEDDEPTTSPRPSGKVAMDSLRGITFSIEDPMKSGLLPGLRRGIVEIEPRLIDSVRRAENQVRQTMRICPFEGPTEVLVGVITELVKVDLQKRFQIEDGTVGYELTTQRLGDRELLQLTMQVDDIAGDPDALDLFSYTFLCPRENVPPSVERGAIIETSLEPVGLFGGDRVWKSKRVEQIG